MSKTTIEWTDDTWNPVRGCVKISPGCKNCYAKTHAERFRGVPEHPFEQGFDPALAPHKLTEPFEGKRRRKIFVNSMSDLFLENFSDEFLEMAFKVMQAADWHVFQILTKRPERMADLLTGKLSRFAACKNIWFGTSVEDAKYAALRIPELLRVPVNGRRFLSCEPLLADLGSIPLDGIGWVIAGGESGPFSRPMDLDWVRSCRDQCLAANVPFFFKQVGGTRKKKTGKKLDGRTWLQNPKFVTARVPRMKERQRRKMVIEAEISRLFPGHAIEPIPVPMLLLRAV
jgi:protein gp37